jgi:hypothetical protein
MVALDNSALMGRAPRIRHLPPAAFIAIAAVIIVLGSQALRGFSENGFRLGSENAWRFTFFVFFAALMAGPVKRLFTRYVPALERLDSCQLVWGFCASYGVFLASLLVQPVMPLTPGLAMFVLLSTMVIVVMALSLLKAAARVLGERARQALLGVAAIYFWLCYSSIALAHISGPHRPDIFYNLSVSLMVVALLVRYADHFVRHMRARPDSVSIAPQ